MAQFKQSETTKSLVAGGSASFWLYDIKSIFHFKIMHISQVAKSGRRARLAADQSSFEDSRYVRKSSTSASVGEVRNPVIIVQLVACYNLT